MTIVGKVGMLLAIGWLAALSCPQARAASVEELLAEINKLPPKERQGRLEEGAKKEGVLSVYSNQGL
ncbi:MAG: hypothetical protein HYV05_09255, partial [Deltaproteobacteria bacterium]|nr:hypothetical protein [Deltaproteobacteria bacterium]